MSLPRSRVTRSCPGNGWFRHRRFISCGFGILSMLVNVSFSVFHKKAIESLYQKRGCFVKRNSSKGRAKARPGGGCYQELRERSNQGTCIGQRSGRVKRAPRRSFG